MLYMVVEKFKTGRVQEIYQRAGVKGRMLPQGLEYLDSWVSADLDRCFQLMRCQDESLLQVWMERWRDLVEFEIVPVIPSKDAAARVLGSPRKQDGDFLLDMERNFNP
jgi:hypothetical protein